MNYRTYQPALGTLISVPLAVIAFPPLELHQFIWIALVPWLNSLLRCAATRDAVIQGLWFNFLFGLGTTLWLAHAVPQYLDVPVALGFVALILHGLLSQLQFVAFAGLFHWQLKKSSTPLGPLGVLLAAALYVGLDWAIPNIFQDTLGLPLHAHTSISQIVELGGAQLLTFVVLIANLGLLSLFQVAGDPDATKREKRLRALASAALVTIVVGSAWSFGAKRYREVTQLTHTPLRTIRVGLVQGSVSNDVKRRWTAGDSQAARDSLDAYIAATEQLLGEQARPSLILWPETAYPGIFRRPENEQQLLINITFDRYIATAGVPFVFGAYDREERTDKRVLRNAIFFVQPRPGQAADQLSPMEVYHKYILFPVGEYLPLFGADAIRRWFPNAGGFSKGSGPRLFEIQQADQKPIRVGPSVCYENVFFSHTAALASMGAEVLINVTNDSWFGDYGEPRFHLIFAKLASIQSRLPQVRATNTGYSALILPNGDMPEVSDYGRTQALNLTVPIIGPQETLATRWKDWFGSTCLLVAASGLLLVRVLATKRESR